MMRFWPTISAGIFLCFCWGITQADDSEYRFVELGPQPAVLAPSVDFIEATPTIDGRLDETLKTLPLRSFSYAYAKGSDSVMPASYRLAYSADFLYVYVEVAGDQLHFRDRAYQNGDGFHMVITAPQPGDAPTSEFYVLACSAVDKPTMEWTRRIFWYYNVEKIFVPTGDDAKLEFCQEDGKISFELLLPWSSVHPYQPWLSDGIGFNLRLIKAVEPDGVMVFGVKDDPRIDGEQCQRLYTRLTFAAPQAVRSDQLFLQPLLGHITEGDSLGIAALTIAPVAGAAEVTAGVYSGEGERLLNQRVPLTQDTLITCDTFWLATSSLPTGGYSVRWTGANGNHHGERGLTVLPPVKPEQLVSRIEQVKDRLSVSSALTLQFLAGEARQKFEATHAYETCGELRTSLEALSRLLEHAQQGTDDLAHATGFVRKAHRSAIDGTLQPYVVWLPVHYDASKIYPLMVFLHGSASDETSFMRRGMRDLIPDGFVAVAPFGRGKSHAYCYDHAQEDIREVIAAVAQDYSIDTSAILLSGFSMGGYGVLRTAWETPGKFAALAIFSGDPNLGQRYSGDTTQPNFEEIKNINHFKGIPVFVFHGEQDRNASFSGTKSMVDSLRAIGAQVQFITEPDKGHELPNTENVRRFHDWVRRGYARLAP